MAPPDPVETFIARWAAAQAAERANYQLFLSELCDVIGVPRLIAPRIKPCAFVPRLGAALRLGGMGRRHAQGTRPGVWRREGYYCTECCVDILVRTAA